MSSDAPTGRRNFVLVHGAAHGAWCWERLVPHLQQGDDVGAVVAVDLPGHGTLADAKPLGEITLDDYIEAVIDAIESRDLRDVVLVGHSLAGITLPSVAHRVADRIRCVVYLASSNPPVGESVVDLMNHPLSPVRRNVDARTMFCNDLGEADAQWLLERLCTEPPGPMSTPVRVVRAPEGMKTTYVLLEQDETLPPAYQREQAENAGVDTVVTLDSGHSAFASRPRELAEILLAA